MSQIPDYTNMSLALSEVLNELGLNEEIVSQRRRSYTLRETIINASCKMTGEIINTCVYCFGSQIEGSTIRGLKSDTDFLFFLNDFNLIEHWRDWKPGIANLLMVYSVTTPPGYCMLQRLRSDVPLPETEIIDQHHFRDSQGRILVKTTIRTSEMWPEQERHGPALSEHLPGQVSYDIVLAFSCDSLLEPIRQWLSQARHSWPTEEMKTYIANSPCFVVPVGSRGSSNAVLEWRISTSLAERCLMFNLNIVQIQVYVLMKLLLKTRININVPEENHISSFICKTVLLHCIQNTDHNIWQSHMLIQCLLYCLSGLYVCVMNENCSHFIISTNNLLVGRFTPDSKQQLVQNFQFLFQDFVSHGILSLHIDDIANRLVDKLNSVISGLVCPPDDTDCQMIYAGLLYTCATDIQDSHHQVLYSIEKKEFNDQISLVQKYLKFLQDVDRNGGIMERSACRLLAPRLCTTLGSLIASGSIQNSNTISTQALSYFCLGLNSDVASSRLKLASAFYMLGDLNKAEIVLRDVEKRYDFNVCVPICSCRLFERILLPSINESLAACRNICGIPNLTANCVAFLPAEISCIPHELLIELSKPIVDYLPHRHEVYDYWMDLVVVDSLPFLHFLQYKVYSRLQRPAEQQRALNNLMLAIQKEQNLGHRETALNLLGLCFQQEHRWNDALWCYCRSMNICPKNNAAILLVCCLIYMWKAALWSMNICPRHNAAICLVCRIINMYRRLSCGT